MSAIEEGTETMKKPKARKRPLPRDNVPVVQLRSVMWASEQLNCGRRTIYALADEGKLELVRLRSRVVRVTERSVVRLVGEQLKERA